MQRPESKLYSENKKIEFICEEFGFGKKKFHCIRLHCTYIVVRWMHSAQCTPTHEHIGVIQQQQKIVSRMELWPGWILSNANRKKNRSQLTSHNTIDEDRFWICNWIILPFCSLSVFLILIFCLSFSVSLSLTIFLSNFLCCLCCS